MNIGATEYIRIIERRKRPRSWFHEVRLWCVRGEDGKCTDPVCKRIIGKPDFEIEGRVGVDDVAIR